MIDVENVRPGIDALLHHIDIIITAQDFPSQLTGVEALGGALEMIQQTYQPTLACATLGENGSLAATPLGEIRTLGFAVPVVDTTGTGDVSRGGFIAGWLLGGSQAQLEDVLRYANATAALKCRALGARQGIPTRAEVATLLMSPFERSPGPNRVSAPECLMSGSGLARAAVASASAALRRCGAPTRLAAGLRRCSASSLTVSCS